MEDKQEFDTFFLLGFVFRFKSKCVLNISDGVTSNLAPKGRTHGARFVVFFPNSCVLVHFIWVRRDVTPKGVQIADVIGFS